MAEDWRLRVCVHEDGIVHAISERLDAYELEQELETTFSDRVVVSADGPELFCYAASREQLDAARALIESAGRERDWKIDFELRRWHPDAQEWKDPELPLPGTGPEREAEHAAMIARERDEARVLGYPSFEVRIECASEHDCEALAERLRSEGLQVVRRSRFLLVGAGDEDSANELAARLRTEAPAGAAVVAEGTVPAVHAGTPFNRFALLGGLGG